MKMEIKIENRLHRNDINRPKPRHGHKYTKNKKKCLSMKILIYIKQYLTLIKLGFLKVVFSGGGQIDPPNPHPLPPPLYISKRTYLISI